MHRDGRIVYHSNVVVEGVMEEKKIRLYKICIDCLQDLKDYESNKLPVPKYHCQQKPRCFDQPERVKENDGMDQRQG